MSDWQVYRIQDHIQKCNFHAAGNRVCYCYEQIKIYSRGGFALGRNISSDSTAHPEYCLCAKCNTFVKIVEYSGTVEHGDLILDGTCAVCGHTAARVVEMPQVSHENN